MATADEAADGKDDGDELDIALRSAAEAAARLLLLSAVLQRAYLEQARHSPEDDAPGERFDLAAWAGAEGLLAQATSLETALLHAPFGFLDAGVVTDLSWEAEALVALGWALGLRDASPGPPLPADPGPILAQLPQPWASSRAFVDGARLRDESAIAEERERAELWLWRVDAERAHRDDPAADRRELEAAIREVANDAARAGLLPAPVDGDMPVNGQPFRRLSPEALDEVSEVATHRLRAINWLCGFGDAWDSVPLDV